MGCCFGGDLDNTAIISGWKARRERNRSVCWNTFRPEYSPCPCYAPSAFVSTERLVALLGRGLRTTPLRPTVGLPVLGVEGDLRSGPVERSGDRSTTGGVAAGSQTPVWVPVPRNSVSRSV